MTTSFSQQARTILTQIFGFQEFRGDQLEVIELVLSGKNALLLMPTGMGKSVCFQIPARILSQLGRGPVLVISPLIALMKDQVDQARDKGFKAAFINSSLNRNDREKRYRGVARGEYELLYVTPERFRKPEFLEALRQGPKVSLMAVDEAHAISEWGHDFRPDYLRLKDIRSELGMPPVLAVTATATCETQKEIIEHLGLGPQDMQVFRHSLERTNLHLNVIPVFGADEKIRAVIGLRALHSGPTIVYSSLISSLRSLSESLTRLNVDHSVYHGDLSSDQRRNQQNQFMSGESSLILATPAFGLGINKADIRHVIHYEIPGTLEAYYQEVGRGGRDGAAAHGTLLFDQDDVSIQEDFLKWATPEPAFIRTVLELIRRNPDRVRSRPENFLRDQMHFYHKRDFRVETALNLLETGGAIARVSNGGTGGGGSGVEFVQEPEGPWLLDDHHSRRVLALKKQLYEMVRYAGDRSQCRMQMILKYFGYEVGYEDSGVDRRCERCDTCLGTHVEGA